ncbi:DNA primase [Buchnera aphidicola (Muscaphis stroyani)]|uniref:DNA primase n=1 Tax=Buchnera aphidicola (Muscaphis stroyani) TaxID=1241869 RepID=A0A4D6YE81_9GAMM|nr:DNA primase [Buchnera aphidicola]QCI24168.1 DNA primase [Buchnera aphidicola (Muscaphis stroyani)]
MPIKIPKHFINELLYRTDIVELIHARLILKKKGKNYQTNCPFHHDKTPSFTVSYEKQFYYCFGCKAHGNAIDFLMNYEHLNFIESIEELAASNGIEIPSKKNEYENQNYIKRKKLYFLMNEMSKLYQKNLLSTNAACNYLAHRGISKNIINFFSIGFSSFKWFDFLKKLKISKNFENELLEYNIISMNQNGSKYDSFRGRIIFPIHDRKGTIIAFGGRSIQQKVLPKYLNSPETDIFNKGRQIYGLYQVKKKFIKPEYLLIVEGYIDVITLTEYNILYAVSSLGTATTKDHIQLLFRNTDTIIYCYDGDTAGKNAAWRSLKVALPYISDKKTIKFILLPNNEDPDTIVRKEGKEKFQIRIKNALTLSNFFFKNILKNINLSSKDDKFRLSVTALPLINQISSSTIRIYLRQILARKIGILEDSQFEKFLYEMEIKNKKIKTFQIKRTPMRILIGLLVQNPNLAKITPSMEKIKNLKLKGLPIFIELLQTCINFPNLNTGQLLELYRNKKIFNVLKILARWDHMIIPEEIQNMFIDLLSNMKKKILEERQEYLISQERIKGLNIKEKQEIWLINKKLSKKLYKIYNR